LASDFNVKSANEKVKIVENIKQKLDPMFFSDADLEMIDLAKLIDVDALQSMMNDLYAVTKIGFAVIDLKGNVLASTGWQDICAKFHRTNPQTLWNCLESDLVLTQGVARGEFKIYKCKNNMWDIVTPIMIGKRHVGNLFSGQFFFDDEAVDRNVFVRQAEQFGFDKEAYLAALDRVPRLNRTVVKNLMQFYVKLAEMISKLSYSNLKLSKLLADQKLGELKLLESHNDLKHAQTVAETGSWRLNVQKNELTWSDETCRMFGLPEGTRLTYERFLEFVHPDDKGFVDQKGKAALRGEVYDVEHRIVIDNKVRWVRERAELEFAADGSLVGGFGVVQDITEYKIAEQKLRRLNRALRAISDINQVLMRVTDETAFLQQVCRIIVEDCGYSLVWIGFAQDDEAKVVKLMAYAGFGEGLIESLNVSLADTEFGQDPAAKAIRTGKPQICADMSFDQNFSTWSKGASARGYSSCIALPLMSEGKAFGVINIYSQEPHSFTEDEVKLLGEIANDFSHGIMHLRACTAVKQTGEELNRAKKEW
jgi:PAS domain S-box-containing protein